MDIPNTWGLTSTLKRTSQTSVSSSCNETSLLSYSSDITGGGFGGPAASSEEGWSGHGSASRSQ